MKDPVLTAEDLLQCAACTPSRRVWAQLVRQALEARAALLLRQGLLRPEDARRGARRWIEDELSRMPAPPLWREPGV